MGILSVGRVFAAQPPQLAFPKEIAAIKFKLTAIKFEGNTLYSNDELLTLFPNKIGTTVTSGEIQQFVNAITLKYNKAGYVLSQAVLPEQAIKKGGILVKVIGGYIDAVAVEGEVDGHIKSIIKQYGSKVVGKKPLNINELESALLLAGDLPGVDVQSVIVPSKKVPGAADLTLLVVHQYFDNSTYLDYDNRGTQYLGPERVVASAYVNSMLGDGDMTGLKLAESGRWNEMRFVEMEHKQYVGTNGLVFDFDGQYTRTWALILII